MFQQGIIGWRHEIFHFSEHLGKSYYHDRLELIKDVSTLKNIENEIHA